MKPLRTRYTSALQGITVLTKITGWTTFTQHNVRIHTKSKYSYETCCTSGHVAFTRLGKNENTLKNIKKGAVIKKQNKNLLCLYNSELVSVESLDPEEERKSTGSGFKEQVDRLNRTCLQPRERRRSERQKENH